MEVVVFGGVCVVKKKGDGDGRTDGRTDGERKIMHAVGRSVACYLLHTLHDIQFCGRQIMTDRG